MLVLSRQPHEKIVLPGLNITIEVLSIKGGVVRLGITAPPDVPILRAELPNRAAEWGAPPAVPAKPSNRQLKHLVSNRLRVARLGLEESRQELQAGRPETAEVLLDKLDEDIHLLQQRLGVGTPEPRPQEPPGFARLPSPEAVPAGDGAAALDYLRGPAGPETLHRERILPFPEDAAPRNRPT
jgi:carbon storage regulator CsrA